MGKEGKVCGGGWPPQTQLASQAAVSRGGLVQCSETSPAVLLGEHGDSLPPSEWPWLGKALTDGSEVSHATCGQESPFLSLLYWWRLKPTKWFLKLFFWILSFKMQSFYELLGFLFFVTVFPDLWLLFLSRMRWNHFSETVCAIIGIQEAFGADFYILSLFWTKNETLSRSR